MQPTMPSVPQPPDELVVRSDNSLLVGRFRGIIIMFSVLTVALLLAIGWLASSDLAVLRNFVWVAIILVAGQIFQLAIQCYFWGGRFAINQPLVISPRGIECQTQQGTVTLPWAAVTRIERTGRMGQSLIAIRVHPQAVPGQNGVEADPQIWAQVVKKGMAFGELGLVPGFRSILPALQHYSQGRVPIG